MASWRDYLQNQMLDQYQRGIMGWRGPWPDFSYQPGISRPGKFSEEYNINFLDVFSQRNMLGDWSAYKMSVMLLKELLSSIEEEGHEITENIVDHSLSKFKEVVDPVGYVTPENEQQLRDSILNYIEEETSSDNQDGSSNFNDPDESANPDDPDDDDEPDEPANPDNPADPAGVNDDLPDDDAPTEGPPIPIVGPRSCPLILDLDGDGVDASVSGFFDHEGDGFAEFTRWVGGDDGLLVWDRNDDGVINSGRELFGNNTVLSDNNWAENGFAALAELDSNDDGVSGAAFGRGLLSTRRGRCGMGGILAGRVLDITSRFFTATASRMENGTDANYCGKRSWQRRRTGLPIVAGGDRKIKKVSREW